MAAILAWLEGIVGAIPLPLLEVWGRFSYVVGLALAICAFGGFTFRIGKPRERGSAGTAPLRGDLLRGLRNRGARDDGVPAALGQRGLHVVASAVHDVPTRLRSGVPK